MAIKPCHFIPFVSLIFLLFAPIGNALSVPKPIGELSDHQVKKMLKFLKPGYGISEAILKKAKGMEFREVVENVKRAEDLTNLLVEYGFLKYKEKKEKADKNETISAALAFQEKYHIKPQGRLDKETFLTMFSPRCAVPDMANGGNSDFFPKNRAWQKKKLTYQFASNVPHTDIAPLEHAFKQWEKATKLITFTRVKVNQAPDLLIGYLGSKLVSERKITLALAHPPTKGVFALTDKVKFSAADTPSKKAFHLETIAMHGIGHLLGLQHSGDKETVMYPIFKEGVVKTKLHEDDIKAFKDLYNPKH